MPPVLDIRDLEIRFATPDGVVEAANEVSLSVEPGETLGIVGESGSGKSQIFMAVMGLLASNGRATGSVKFQGEEILGRTPAELNKIRGARMSMIFQDPMTSLNPYLTIERQLTEVLETHRGMSAREARQAAVDMLERVQIPEADRRISHYPLEFSGGMRQRVMIAMALLCQPELLIADEPTTALDVTVQAQILDLMGELKQAGKTSFVVITHDLGVIAGLCDRVLVMYARPHRRDRARARHLQIAAASLYGRAARLHAAAGRDGGASPHHHPRPAAQSAAPAAGLRLQRPLPPGVRALPPRAPAPRNLRAREDEGMPSAPSLSTAPLLSVQDLKVHFHIGGGWFSRHRRAS